MRWKHTLEIRWHIQQARESLSIPVAGSLHGHSTGGLTGYVTKIEQAGADTLELNIYCLPTCNR